MLRNCLISMVVNYVILVVVLGRLGAVGGLIGSGIGVILWGVCGGG